MLDLLLHELCSNLTPGASFPGIVNVFSVKHTRVQSPERERERERERKREREMRFKCFVEVLPECLGTNRVFL